MLTKMYSDYYGEVYYKVLGVLDFNKFINLMTGLRLHYKKSV